MDTKTLVIDKNNINNFKSVNDVKNAVINTAENAAKAAENNGEQTKVVKFETSVSTEKANEQKPLTLQDYKEKAINAFHLQAKHNELTAKRQELKEFEITSDRQNATISVTDRNGKTFTSNSPKSIKKLIEFWTEEFTNAIEEVENEIKNIFATKQAAMQPQMSKAV